MIVVRLTDRLGNNLFQYAAARGVASRLGTNVAVMGPPSRLTQFRLRSDTEFVDERDVVSMNLTVRWEANGHGYDPSIAELHDNTWMGGYWQSEKYFAHIADEIANEFCLKETFRPHESALVSRMRDHSSIALHVRRGDYVHNVRATRGHGVLGPAYYRNAFRLLLHRGISGEVFGFSDDPHWCKEHLDLPMPVEWLDANAEEPERDLALMASCRHVIIANSSFSWWGAWLAGCSSRRFDATADQVVIAPRRWFDGYQLDASDVVPSRWTKVANPPTFDQVGVRRVLRQLVRPLGVLDNEGVVRWNPLRERRSK